MMKKTEILDPIERDNRWKGEGYSREKEIYNKALAVLKQCADMGMTYCEFERMTESMLAIAANNTFLSQSYL